MIFEYKPGRPVKGATRAPELPKPPTWIHDDHDPFPSADEWRAKSVDERVSWLEEMGRWIQQWLSELAALAKKLESLKRKLADPALADSPHRRKAVNRAEQMEDDLIQLMRDIAWTECEADRSWRSLAPEQRAPIAGHWMTEPETPRLVGAAWFRLSQFEEWPLRFRLNRLHFNDFPEPLIRDMHEAQLWLWNPNPGPPDPWPDAGRMPVRIAEQLHERGAL